MSEYADVLVLGVGNILMGDEGIGVYVVKELKKKNLPSHIEVIDAGTALFSIVHLLRKRKKIVIIDAARGGEKPGTIYRILPSRIKSRYQRLLSLHEMGLRESLDALEEKEETQEVVIIGVEPAFIDWGLRLSPVVRGKLPEIIKIVLSEISS